MPAAAIIMFALSIVIAAIGLTLVVMLSLRDWIRTAAEIDDRRRRVIRDRAR